MALKIQWELEGELQLSRKLRKIGEGVKYWYPAFKEASDKLKEVFQEDNFITQGQTIGEPWKPLSPKYLAQKRRTTSSTYADWPLIKTGKMRASFVSEVKNDYAIISNTSEYFKYHQSNKPRSKIPRRVMMKLDNPQKSLVVRIFQEYWQKKTS